MSNILIDIGHPAHVHYYKFLARKLESRGHKVYWTVKDLPIAKYLLESYGFNYKTLPRKSDDIFGKVVKQLVYNLIILSFCLKNKIKVAIGTSVSIVYVSKILNVTSIVFDDDDDEVQPFFTKFVSPFADILVSPDSLEGKRRRTDTIYYPGFHELAYLHPKVFDPDPSILKEVGITKDDTFFILRFNVFKAHHDIGESGLNLSQKLEIVRLLEPHGKIFITTEREIESELSKYQLKISPDKIHSLMAFCKLFIGDSQTMTSESAMLGVPSIRCNSFAGRISYLEELENEYELTYSYSPPHFASLKTKIQELLSIKDLKSLFESRRNRMIDQKIDVTAFWLWLVENHDSLDCVEDNKLLFDRFR